MDTTDKALAWDKLTEKNAKLAALREEVRRLRAGIESYLDGNYPTAAKNDKCSHGRYGFEGCENCIDEYFTQLLKEPI